MRKTTSMKATLFYPIAVKQSALQIIPNTLVHVLVFETLGFNERSNQGLEVYRIKQDSRTKIIVLTDFSESMEKVNARLRPKIQISGPGVPLPQIVDVPDALVRYAWTAEPRPHGEILQIVSCGLPENMSPFQIFAPDIFTAWNELFERLLTPS